MRARWRRKTARLSRTHAEAGQFEQRAGKPAVYSLDPCLQGSWPHLQVNVVIPLESWQNSEQYFEPGSAGQLQAS